MADPMTSNTYGYITRQACARCGKVKSFLDFIPDKPRGGRGRISNRCKDCRAAAGRIYKEQNRERLLALQRKWNAKNAERLKPYRAAHYEANQETRRAQERARYAQDYAVNPEKYRAKFHERRARILSNGGCYTEQEWLALCAKYGNICLMCHKKKKLTIDHIVPVSQGGTNDIDNIQPLCRSCNSRKSDKTMNLRQWHDAYQNGQTIEIE